MTTLHKLKEVGQSPWYDNITIEENLEDAKIGLKSLEDEGISIDRVCEKLQVEGVKKFIESFDALIDSIAKSTR